MRRVTTNEEESHQEYAIEFEGADEFGYVPVSYEMGRQIIRETGVGQLVARTVTTITEPWWPIGPDPSDYEDSTNHNRKQRP